MSAHLIKLAVGCNSIADLAHWQAGHVYDYNGTPANIIYTRHMPKQADAMLESGASAYRVINGITCCRQKLIGFERIDTEEGQKTLIYTDTKIIRTQPQPRRAFQGWRYLKPEDAPADIGLYEEGEEEGDFELQAQLRELGLI